jgi:hypothetical protein
MLGSVKLGIDYSFEVSTLEYKHVQNRTNHLFC